ncbi:MAG: hypothetical protein AVDCRST_MAG56-8230 [uncultured Cytophagales bacterium]|uniref:Uncharacterized protein n=1 Tax=uncultured Cytophagales bacterium TaxID=158755 RepID=A0A6J4LR10_9SPHI|nr:MAG: hypothetical protein AVDCRST_MAG56-8230 [uncultured Cytophagales bacterium]
MCHFGRKIRKGYNPFLRSRLCLPARAFRRAARRYYLPGNLFNPFYA